MIPVGVLRVRVRPVIDWLCPHAPQDSHPGHSSPGTLFLQFPGLLVSPQVKQLRWGGGGAQAPPGLWFRPWEVQEMRSGLRVDGDVSLQHCEDPSSRPPVVRLTSLVRRPRTGIARPNGTSAFSFLSNCQTVFHRGCTILHSHQQSARVPISPPPGQHLLFWKHASFSSLTAVLAGSPPSCPL